MISNIKSKNGITLVAIVITIIVLIILAGVAIATLAGDNGLIAKAKQAAGKHSNEAAKEANTINKIIGMLSSNKDGSYVNGVNTPKIEGTGLTAVYWDSTSNTWIELTEKSTEQEWDKWYSYTTDKKEWANAKSADGSMWIWIPRYEYRIDNENESIDVKFISTDIKDGTEGYTTDSTGIIKSSDNYIIHPAFTTSIENGGWNKELPGFWVSKYVAGYQNSTAGEETKTVVNSNLKYTEIGGYTSNFFNETLIANTTNLSYPVFKANTYAYNIITVADAWLLSQEIDTTSMYGLSNVDSHLEKNSEWGAVAYLTHSQYGVNGNSTNMNEVEINNKSLKNTIYVNNNPDSGIKANIHAVTSYGDTSKNAKANNVAASSTKNMTGVFDLNGCVWERTAGYLKGGEAITSNWHNAMANSSTIESTEYLTVYTDNNKIGDATNETAAWNEDYSDFIAARYPVFVRGGRYDSTTRAGIFAFGTGQGSPGGYDGFRVCLAF